MNRIHLGAALLSIMLSPGVALAACPVGTTLPSDTNCAISDLTVGGAISDTDAVAICQTPSGCYATSPVVTITQQPVGSLANYVKSKLTGCVNILDHGGAGDGTTDNLPAWNAVKSVSRCIYFPSGKYRFSAGISYTYPADLTSFTVYGDGADLTELTWPTAVGTAIDLAFAGFQNTAHIRQLTLSTGTNAVDTGLRFRQMASTTTPFPLQLGMANSDVTEVAFRSSEGYWLQDPAHPTTHMWKKSVWVTDVSMIDFQRVIIMGPTPQGSDGWPNASGGDGFTIESSTPSAVKGTNVFNFDRINAQWLNNVLICGQSTQGYTMSMSNMTSNRVGITANTGMQNLAGLNITTSQFNNLYSILLYSVFPLVQITNSSFWVNDPGAAIMLQAPSSATTVTGNVFAGTRADPLHSGLGVRLASSIAEAGLTDTAAAVITGNVFMRLNYGVMFDANEDAHVVATNVFRHNATNIANASTSPTIAITGGTGSIPAQASVSGAVANGAGAIRLTVNTTASFVSGQMVYVGGVGGVTGASTGLVDQAQIIDATHMDLPGITFAGTYTSGGWVSSLPP